MSGRTTVTIYDPPVTMLHGVDDQLARIGSKHHFDRPHAVYVVRSKYKAVPGLFVEFNEARLRPNEARQLARYLLRAAQVAEELSEVQEKAHANQP